MQKRLLFYSLLITGLISFTGLAQLNQNWKWVHPYPQGNRLNYVKTWSITEWYCVGFAGTFMKTTDGGYNWTYHHNIGRKVGTSLQSAPIYDAYFFDLNTGIAVGGNGTISRTTDAGMTWTEPVSPLALTSTVVLYQVYFLNNNIGYACGSTGNLLKTVDGGLNWTAVTTGVTTTLYDVYTHNDTLIFLATTSGNIRRSTDGGATWANINTGITTTLYKVDFVKALNGTVGLTAGASGGVRITTDGGLTWIAGSTGLPATSSFYDIDFRPAPDGFNVFVTGDAFNIYRSHSGSLGAVWDTVGFLSPTQPWTSTFYATDLSVTGDTLATVGAYGLIQARAGAGGHYAISSLISVRTILDAAITPNGQTFIHVGTPSIVGSTFDQIFRSTDGGNTFAAVQFTTVSTCTLWTIDMVDNNTGYAAGTNSAIYKTTNGGATWDSLVTTIPAGITLRKIDFIDANTGWAFVGAPSTSTSFIYKTTDGGVTWNPQSHGITGSNGQIYGAHMLTATDGYIISWDPIPLRTTDGGNTWTAQTLVDAFGGYLYDIKMVDPENGYCAGSSGRVYKTTNGGTLWDTLSVPTRSYSFYSIEMPRPNYLMIFGGTGVTMYTTDGGVTWTQENTGAAAATLYGSALTADLQNNTGTFWAVGSGSVVLKNTLVPIPVELTAFGASVADGTVMLNWKTATEINNSGFEVHRSSDGTSWTKIGFVAGSGTSVSGKDYSYIDKSVTTGKYSYRLRQVDFNGTATYSGVVEVDLTSPFTFALDQNYPNPFNPATSVKFQVAEKTLVTLKVYDVIGNEVATLVNKEQETGSYIVKFDASKYASGMYIYKLTAGKFEKTMKMMLLK